MKHPAWILVVAWVMLLVSCGRATVEEPTIDLDGTWWKLHAIVSPEGDRNTLEGWHEVTLGFAGPEMGGRMPCNFYSTQYLITGRQFTFPEGGVTQTLIGCDVIRSQQDRFYLEVLEAVTRVEVVQGRLRLSGRLGILEYVPGEPPDGNR